MPDGWLAAAHEAAPAFQRMAKAENTRIAYRAAVRAWCAWRDRHGGPAQPATSPDVAAFLAGERGRDLAPNTIDLRRAAARRGALPTKKVAATATILRLILVPTPDDFPGFFRIAP